MKAQRFDSVMDALGLDDANEIQVEQLVPPEIGYGKPPQQDKGFAAETASISGETKQSINRRVAIADALGDDLDKVVGTSLDKGVELAALAKLPEEQRAELIERAQAGEKVTARKVEVAPPINDAAAFVLALSAGVQYILDATDCTCAEDVVDAINKLGELDDTYRAELDKALDSLRVAVALERHLQAEGRSLDVFVQVNTSGEASKYGLPPEDVPTFIQALPAFAALRVRGLMTLALFSNQAERVRQCFALLRALRDRLRQSAPAGIGLDELSMGMSGDFEIAIEEGVKFFVYGNLDYGLKKAGYDSKYRVGHYDGKGRIAEWILLQNQANSARMGAAIFTSGPYIEMTISPLTPMAPSVEDGVVTWRVPLGDGAVPHVSLEDCGYYVR